MTWQNWDHVYLAIDLKSFFASVECVARNLDPLYCNLVVADESRTNKTICLAVSPALKQWGVPGRPRMFEVAQIIKEKNSSRQTQFASQKSYDNRVLQQNRHTKISYVVAKPRMQLYLETSTKIFQLYTKFVAPADIHVYSIDEAFMDITPYLAAKKQTPHQFAQKLITAVKDQTGITATVGIGQNLYLAKVAMDIVAKKMNPTKDGSRIASLSELKYRQLLWSHRPLTDFWRIGSGIAKRLEKLNIKTMGDLAQVSLNSLDCAINPSTLVREFGVNANLLIDHAWGIEPTTIAAIKHYQPKSHSISSGQVLMRPYSKQEARTILVEMLDDLALKLTEKQKITAKIALTINYDPSSPSSKKTTTDHYGRRVAAPTTVYVTLPQPTNSSSIIRKQVSAVFLNQVPNQMLIRKITLTCCQLSDETSSFCQLDLFAHNHFAPNPKEQQRQAIMLKLNRQFGKNSVIKAVDLLPEATQKIRNHQIGGHHD